MGSSKKSVAIIGGGASGVFASINLKKHTDLDVYIFERQNRVLKKVLQTGNGMCNISNQAFSDSKNLIDVYNHNEILDIFKSFDINKCKDFFNDIGLLIKQDDAGRYYPYSKKASNVCDILLNALNQLNVNIVLNTEIVDIQKNDKFILVDNNKREYKFDYVIVACGGMSQIQFINNTYNVLKKLNHNIEALRPGLSGFKLKENVKSLSGLKLKCDATLIQNGKTFKEYNGEVTFKDDGISGIILLDISRFYNTGSAKLSLDLMSEYKVEEVKAILNKYTYSQSLENALLGLLPKMVGKYILNKTNDINEIAHLIKNFEFNITETYPFIFSQITKGGVSINDINLDSFESKKVDNLYIVGEVVDVDGKCGGYNLHFAWTSAYLASNDIISKEE